MPSLKKCNPHTPAEPRQDAFLEALAEIGRADLAAEKIGIQRETVYKWRRRDPEFVKRMDAARREASLILEDEAKRRAVDGVEEPVFYLGQECGAIRRYSDTLLIFLLKCNNPEKFRDIVHNEHTGKDGGAIELKAAELSDAELLVIAARGKK